MESAWDREKVQHLFEICDPEKNGYLTRDSILDHSMDLNLTLDEADIVFQSLDKNDEGFVSLRDFDSMVTKSVETNTNSEETVSVQESKAKGGAKSVIPVSVRARIKQLSKTRFVTHVSREFLVFYR